MATRPCDEAAGAVRNQLEEKRREEERRGEKRAAEKE